jgi:hypothetical protein
MYFGKEKSEKSIYLERNLLGNLRERYDGQNGNAEESKTVKFIREYNCV